MTRSWRRGALTAAAAVWGMTCWGGTAAAGEGFERAVGVGYGPGYHSTACGPAGCCEYGCNPCGDVWAGYCSEQQGGRGGGCASGLCDRNAPYVASPLGWWIPTGCYSPKALRGGCASGACGGGTFAAPGFGGGDCGCEGGAVPNYAPVAPGYAAPGHVAPSHGAPHHGAGVYDSPYSSGYGPGAMPYGAGQPTPAQRPMTNNGQPMEPMPMPMGPAPEQVPMGTSDAPMDLPAPMGPPMDPMGAPMNPMGAPMGQPMNPQLPAPPMNNTYYRPGPSYGAPGPGYRPVAYPGARPMVPAGYAPTRPMIPSAPVRSYPAVPQQAGPYQAGAYRGAVPATGPYRAAPYQGAPYQAAPHQAAQPSALPGMGTYR